MAKRKAGIEKTRSLSNITVIQFVDEWAYRIDMDADYQREKIWTDIQQQLLLDSILRDIDIPKIYIVKIENSGQFDYECIDGKQRMTALLRFFKPEINEKSPLKVRHYEREYDYKEFKQKFPSDAKKIEDYELSFVVYRKLDDGLIREIFRRLQLGIRLNSGELLKSRTGTIRDFVYKEIGGAGPFFRNTNLSEKRFSRQFTLSQICVNSFSRAKQNGEFVRARLQDIEDFYEENQNLSKNDENLVRIKKVLELMDTNFGTSAAVISSRAVAVTAFLFIEEMIKNKKERFIAKFAEFFINLLNDIKHNMELLRGYNGPENAKLMENFQKYILQASVEGYSIKRRHEYLMKEFTY